MMAEHAELAIHRQYQRLVAVAESFCRDGGADDWWPVEVEYDQFATGQGDYFVSVITMLVASTLDTSPVRDFRAVCAPDGTCRVGTVRYRKE